MVDDGQLTIYSTREEVGSLRFGVDSHLDFASLDVYRATGQDEELLDTFVVGERTTYTTQPFTLTQGINVFRFHSDEGCPEVLDDSRCWSDALLAPPDEGPPPCDARTTCRSFVFDALSFIPVQELARGEAASVNFGNQMRLRGWALEPATLRPGDTLTTTLTWEALVRLSSRHVVFAHLLSPEGELVAQYDDAPVGKILPRSGWSAGATFRYPVTIELPGDLPAGDYRLLVGVYLWPSLERLSVLSDVPDAENGTIELGEVELRP
jgi:hypothetical protein